METQPYHIPALLSASVDALNIRPSGVYVDCTLGGGGHTRAILQAIADADATADGASGRLLSFDQDSDAINRALADPDLGANPRLQLVHGNFRYLANFLRYYGAAQVDGILADLGVSFHHFDDAERGFSFRFEGPLDMRMNRDAHRSAATLLAEMSQQELTDIFRLYGELKQAPRIAAAIVKGRTEAPVDTIERLLGVSEPYISPRQQKKELAQLFQALRIAVNDEIGALRSLLVQARRVLRPGGRLAIITYHSLEDRLVKNFLRSGNLEGREEKDFFGRSLSPFRLLTSKPIVPDEAEIEANPRSRSAKLRVAEKLPDKE
jgi:16S rRNA (cytosine1402-N4)-methyltransferase